MDEQHNEAMVQKLKPVLKDPLKAKVILQRYWRTRMALVWMINDVHRAANECEVALTNAEAIDVLQILLNQHNKQYGLNWHDLIQLINDRVLGRKLTKREVKQFVHHDQLIIQR